MDYPELIAEVSERAGEPGLAMRAVQLTRMAEAEINKRLRVGNMEAQATLRTGTDKTALLPDDFMHMRAVQKAGKQVRQWSLYDIQTGSRAGYAVQGLKLITTFGDAELVIDYYRGVPALSFDPGDFESGDFDPSDFVVQVLSNWLLDREPEIYVFALLKQWYLFKMDMEKATAAGAYLDRLLDARAHFDKTVRFAGVRFRTAGPTP